jgi:hypothetical protein
MTGIGRALRANLRAVVVIAAAAGLVLAGQLEVALGAMIAVVALSVRVRRRPPAAGVELGTESALRALDATAWVSARSGSFEHLVVGPSGAFLLETKRVEGEAMLREGVLAVFRDGAWRGDEALGARMRAAARDARRLLGAANINWVAPVVVLWCEFPAQLAEHGGVTYVHGSRLADWLEWQPESVSAQSVENARSCLRRLEADALRDAA